MTQADKYGAPWAEWDRVQLLRGLAEGYDYNEIAVKLKRTRDGVEKECRRLRKSFGVKNIPHLIYVVMRKNIID